MKNEYIITNQELNEAGINLLDYAREPNCINAIIHQGLDIAVDRICYNSDNIKSEKVLERELDKIKESGDEFGYIDSFKKLQRTIIYRLIFGGTNDPIDVYVDTIITKELPFGKINGFQKGLWFKNY